MAVASLLAPRCGGGTTTAPTVPPTPTGPPGGTTGPTGPPPGPPSPPQTFVGAGDIGWCGSTGPQQTARLLAPINGTVFAVGDEAYPNGSRQNFNDCYDPSWGNEKYRTRPVPGNHEYQQPGAGPYFDYFGTQAGPYGLGYYSFDMGDWHAVALNSLLDVGAGSMQAAWLKQDLAASTKKCTIAYWHYPLFTSGPNGPNGQLRDFWQILYDRNVEIVVNGHDHLYERFAPQTPDGVQDDARGIREFIVGTGGAILYNFVTMSRNSEMRIANFGVLKFTLSSTTYDWQFIPVSGPGDSGSGTCH